MTGVTGPSISRTSTWRDESKPWAEVVITLETSRSSHKRLAIQL
jgi:hypothetical protein